jgi:hypothetical protein
MSYFEDYFDYYDQRAEPKKVAFEKWTWKLGIWVGFAAVVTFAITVSFPDYLTKNIKGLLLPVLEVALVIASIILLGKKANPKKTEFLRFRHFAEYLRINQTFSEVGLPINTQRPVYERTIESEKHIYKIPAEIKHREFRYQTFDTDTETIKNTLIDFIQSQKKYHTGTRIEGYEKSEHFLELILRIILFLFIFTVSIKLLFELLEYHHVVFIHHHTYLIGICKFLVITLPPLYAAFEGIAYFSEWKRNIKISKELNQEYEKLISNIKSAQTHQDLMPIAQKLEDTFWREQLNWLAWFDGKKIEARV